MGGFSRVVMWPCLPLRPGLGPRAWAGHLTCPHMPLARTQLCDCPQLQERLGDTVQRRLQGEDVGFVDFINVVFTAAP